MGLACAHSAQFLGAAVVIVGDLIPERLAQARSFGCETIDISKGEVPDQIEQILRVPEVDAAVDCVGFEAKGHGADSSHEAPATVLNSVMGVARAGASIGILASAVDPRIKVLDALDPWGDWPLWMKTSPFVPEEERPQYVTPEFLKKAAVLDPVDWLPKIQAKKFRLQDAAFDPNTPKLAKEKLQAAVPAGTTLAIYRTPDEFNEIVRNKRDLEWIQGELGSMPVMHLP